MDADLQRLLEAWLSGEVGQDTEQLLDRLRCDPAFRKAFCDEIVIHGQLRAVQSAEPRWLQLEDVLESGDSPCAATAGELEDRVMQAVGSGRSVRARQRRVSRAGVAGVSAVVSAILMFAVWVVVQSPEEPAALPGGPSADLASGYIATAEDGGYAMLSSAVEAKWAGERSPRLGDSIGDERLQLDAGRVEIEFVNGVQMFVDGPADFAIRSVDKVVMHRGKASCYVSEFGHGFRVVHGETELIDRGTAFAVSVAEPGNVEVHVLEGEIEIRSKDAEPRRLLESSALRLDGGLVETVAYEPDQFTGPGDLQDAIKSRDQQRLIEWRRSAASYSNDPSTLVHYTFESATGASNTVRNESVTRDGQSNGVLVGCKLGEGRWPGKRAVVFRHPNDRLLLDVPGAYEAVTFVVWARIDALTQEVTSLLMTEDPVRRQRFTEPDSKSIEGFVSSRAGNSVSKVRWVLLNGQFRSAFRIGYGRAETAKYRSVKAPISGLQPQSWGNWGCYVVTYDNATKAASLYFNGELVGHGAIENSDPLPLNFLSVGNFTIDRDPTKPYASKVPPRFYGAIDEVLIANRAFDASEVRSLYRSGAAHGDEQASVAAGKTRIADLLAARRTATETQRIE